MNARSDFVILQKFNKMEFDLFSRFVFDEKIMNQNLGRVFYYEEAVQFFKMIVSLNTENSGYGYYKAIENVGPKGECVGMGALVRNDEFNAVEVEYMVFPEYWNRGYGTRILHDLERVMIETIKNINIVAVVDPMNVYSKKILNSNKFTFEKEYINPDGDKVELYMKEVKNTINVTFNQPT